MSLHNLMTTLEDTKKIQQFAPLGIVFIIWLSYLFIVKIKQAPFPISDST